MRVLSGTARLLLLVASLASTMARGEVRVVPSVAWPTIQAAINASAAGDSVDVLPGTYTGPGNRALDFHGVPLRVRGVGGAAVTIIDCELAACGAFFHTQEGAQSVLSGLTIRRGYNNNYRGGGICCWNGSSPTIEDCRIVECQCFDGGGVGAMGSSPVLVRCVIEGNSSGGVFAMMGGHLTVIDSVVRGNVASAKGGGISALSVSLTMSGTIVSGNRAGWGGGVSCASLACGFQQVTGCTIAGNFAAHQGGGLWLGSSFLDLIRSTLWGNAAGGEGANAYLYSDDVSGALGLGCCVYDPATVVTQGPIAVDAWDSAVADPVFCGPVSPAEAPTVAGDLHVGSDSPCLPGASPCGEQIGVLGEGCLGGTSGASPGAVLSPRELVFSPNPFQGSVRIFDGNAGACDRKLDVFTVDGRLLRRLSGGVPGGRDLIWDGRDDQGLPAPAGVYLVRAVGAGGIGTGTVVRAR